MDTLLVTINSLLTAAAALIPSTGSLLDNRFGGLKKIKTRGWLTLLCVLVSISLTVYQSDRSKKESEKKEAEAKIEQSRKEIILKLRYDSSLIEMKKKFDISNVATVQILSETLGKYGFKLDSTSKKLVRVVRDSSKVRIIESASPVLMLCPMTGITSKEDSKGRYLYDIAFCSRDAGSTEFNLSIRSAFLDSLNVMWYGDSHSILPKNTQIPKDTQYETVFGFIAKPGTNLVIIEQYLYISGTYKNVDKSKTFQIDQVYKYKLKDKTLHVLTFEERDRIVKLIESNSHQRFKPIK